MQVQLNVATLTAGITSMLHGNIVNEKTTVLDEVFVSRCQTAFFRLSCGFCNHKTNGKRGVATQDQVI